jgi:hypothetical protein
MGLDNVVHVTGWTHKHYNLHPLCPKISPITWESMTQREVEMAHMIDGQKAQIIHPKRHIGRFIYFVHTKTTLNHRHMNIQETGVRSKL